jgi:hypothetical protein
MEFFFYKCQFAMLLFIFDMMHRSQSGRRGDRDRQFGTQFCNYSFVIFLFAATR